MVRSGHIELFVEDVYLERGSITISSKRRGTSITLRRFQEEVVRLLGAKERESSTEESESVRYIAVEAPTGGGKTFATLAPLISNVLFDTGYGGVAGVYPTKPLVNDQFISIRDTLDRLGYRESEIRVERSEGGEARAVEVAIKYRLELEVADRRTGTTREVNTTLGLVRLTRETLDRLQGSLRNASGRLSLLDLVRRALLDADYLISVAVPEYPYLMLSSLYRSVPDAQKLLSLAAEEGFVYSLTKEIASSVPEKAVEIVRRFRSELAQLLQPKSTERERFNVYSALFSEVMFLDEFHTWTVYERPAVLALILLHYFESLRTPRPERYKVILSSATPQREFYDLLRRLNLGEVVVVRATPVGASPEADRVKSGTVVRFVPCQTGQDSGAISWFMVEDHIPGIVEELASEIRSRERAIVFGRRNAVVEEAAEAFCRVTGEEPVVVTGVKTKFPGKELLEQRRESGRLYVFGNYSVELGIDLRRIPFGVVYGVYLGEVVQRLGRVGRGDVDRAEVVIPIPSGYRQDVEQFVEKHGNRVGYQRFVELLRDIMPEKLGVEVYGTEFATRHKLGKLRVYLPLATYVLTLVALWEHVEELRRLCKRFAEVVDALEIPGIFRWMKKVSKSADVLVPLASFRVTTSVPYRRDGIEDYAPLSTLLGNYDVRYENGRLVIEGTSKKSLQGVLALGCRRLPRELFDTLLPSNLLLLLMEESFTDNSRRTVLYRVLKDYPIPVYVAPVEEDYGVFNAFGYAIRVEIAMEGKAFYLLTL